MAGTRQLAAVIALEPPGTRVKPTRRHHGISLYMLMGPRLSCETNTMGDIATMHRLLFAAVGALILAAGGAHAATCPAFPPPVIKFVPLPSDVERDTSKSAKDLAATRAAAKPLMSAYEAALSASTNRSVSTLKQADGTVCAALHEVDIKLGFQRKIYVAQEFAGNACVADTAADLQAPLVKTDDETLAQFGATIERAYASEINAIGMSTGTSQEDAQKPLLDKMSALMKEKIFPAFTKQVADADAKVDLLSQWKKAACDGATDKAFASIDLKPSDISNNKVPSQQPARAGGYGGGGYGRN
jgi:hypothetical protein